MTTANGNTATPAENTIDLAFLQNRCFEIQALIYSACGDIGFAEIPLAPRAVFKGLKPLLREVLDHIDHDDELSLRLGRLEAMARMIILAGKDEHDLSSIEHVLYLVLNDFRKAAGIPEVDMMDCDDLDEAQRAANAPQESAEAPDSDSPGYLQELDASYELFDQVECLVDVIREYSCNFEGDDLDIKAYPLLRLAKATLQNAKGALMRFKQGREVAGVDSCERECMLLGTAVMVEHAIDAGLCLEEGKIEGDLPASLHMVWQLASGFGENPLNSEMFNRVNNGGSYASGSEVAV